MVPLKEIPFDAGVFLAQAGLGRRIVTFAPKQPFFSQGDPADSVFYLQKGRAKVTVVSAAGKEATILMLAGRRVCWGGRFGSDTGAATIHCNCDHRLQRDADQA